MGLEITHYKATLEKAAPHSLFYIGHDIYGKTGAEIREKFDTFNVEFDLFQKYIQEIEVPTEIENVIIVKGRENKEKVQAHFLAKPYFRSRETTFIIRENEAQLKQALDDFEQKKGYQNLQKEFQEIEDMDWKILQYSSVEKKEGFYFKIVGELRKGMNRKFWDKFCKGDIYNFALKEDFEYAFSCVDRYTNTDTAESIRQRREKFKEMFLDNFELGASFMSVSY